MHAEAATIGLADEAGAAAPLLSVVIPLYREGAHLAGTLQTIVDVLEGCGLRHELILVDDGSPDDTWAAIGRLRERLPGVRALRLSRNFGKEAALAAGLDLAAGELVLLMDGDGQHPPSLIPAMLQAWRAGAEVVEAVKADRGDGPWQRLQARAFYRLFALLTGQDLRNASDFKLMDRRVLEAWRSLGERNLFFRGMHAWLGFRRVQLPFDVPARIGGRSGWSLAALLKLAGTAVTAFSSVPLQMISLAGGLFGVFALVLGIQTLYAKMSGHAVEGFTTVILLLLVIGSALMLGLGIIGSYLARIYDEVKGRPRYIVAERL